MWIPGPIMDPPGVRRNFRRVTFYEVGRSVGLQIMRGNTGPSVDRQLSFAGATGFGVRGPDFDIESPYTQCLFVRPCRLIAKFTPVFNITMLPGVGEPSPPHLDIELGVLSSLGARALGSRGE